MLPLRSIAWLLLSGFLLQPVAAVPLQADSERYRAAADARSSVTASPRRLDYLDPDRWVLRLPPLEPEAWATPEDGTPRRQRLGVGRDLPEQPDPAELRWVELSDGGLVTSLQITSPAALALRLQVHAVHWPEAAELRVHGPDTEAVLTGIDLKTDRMRWLPTVAGDTVMLEWYLPPGSDPATVDLELSGLSHLHVSPRALLQPRRLQDIGRSGACQVDVACQNVGLPDVIVDSVAKYLFSDDSGQTFGCTGQLLSDTDPDSQIPYFLTAHHCIDRATVAASMEFYWFFQRDHCAAATPVSLIRTDGGATLLAAERQTDFSLLRLNRELPEGVGFSGWSAEPVRPGDPVFGLHHPRGDLRKISRGNVRRLVAVQGQSARDDFIETEWFLGVTEVGSSGSGLWLERDGEPRLVGTLFGGHSSCHAPRQPDYYGRFDRTLAQIVEFLAPPPQQIDATPRLLNLSTNGTVDTDHGLIAGFIVTGDAPKRFVVMGENQHGLADPELRIRAYPGGELLAYNDDWREHPTAGEIEARLRRPAGERDAALALTLAPGQYLATLGDRSGRGGRGLISVTEIGGGVGGRLLNLSTNGMVGAELGLISGFIVEGGSRRVALMGEDLGGLADPEIAVVSFPDLRPLAGNDDWRNSATGAEVAAKLRAPRGDRDAALALTLEPGQYLVTLRDRAGRGGRGLISVTEIAP